MNDTQTAIELCDNFPVCKDRAEAIKVYRDLREKLGICPFRTACVYTSQLPAMDPLCIGAACRLWRAESCRARMDGSLPSLEAVNAELAEQGLPPMIIPDRRPGDPDD